MAKSSIDSSASARIREQLTHPVIDGDGHWLPPFPMVADFLSDAGGPSMVDRYRSSART